MSALILKSVNHLYRILKVYLTLAILGALAVVAYELLSSKPVAILISFISLSFVLTTILLWFQAKTPSVDLYLDLEPPKLPQYIMYLILPARQREVIIGDLNEEFSHLLLKYGRKSAATWYAIQSMMLVLRISTIHISFVRTKRVADDIVKK